ncbi:reverse transcriptase domain-containing protein [Tanacetum coccineum]
MPKALISDQGTHFCNKIMERTMKRYGVNHHFSKSYHPQTSGQVKNTNKALKRILEKTVKDNPTIWSRKLNEAMWAFRTAYKTPPGSLEDIPSHYKFKAFEKQQPDIAFATFVCARYQARHAVKHLKEVKRIFRCLRQSYNIGRWYPKDSGFELIAYSDADHAGCHDDCKCTSGGLQFLEYQLAEPFTKALLKERFEYLVHRIGMRCMTPTQLDGLTKLSS